MVLSINSHQKLNTQLWAAAKDLDAPPSLVQKLVKQGASVTARNQEGLTAFHLLLDRGSSSDKRKNSAKDKIASFFLSHLTYQRLQPELCKYAISPLCNIIVKYVGQECPEILHEKYSIFTSQAAFTRWKFDNAPAPFENRINTIFERVHIESPIIKRLVQKAACFDSAIFDSFTTWPFTSDDVIAINQNVIKVVWDRLASSNNSPLPLYQPVLATLVKDYASCAEALVERRHLCSIEILAGLIPFINRFINNETMQSICLRLLMDSFLATPNQNNVGYATQAVLEMRDPFFQASALSVLNQYRTHDPLCINIKAPQLPPLSDGFETEAAIDNDLYNEIMADEKMTTKFLQELFGFRFSHEIINAAKYFNSLIKQGNLIQELIHSPQEVMARIDQLRFEIFQIVCLKTIVEVIKSPLDLTNNQAQRIIFLIRNPVMKKKAQDALEGRSPKIELLD